MKMKLKHKVLTAGVLALVLAFGTFPARAANTIIQMEENTRQSRPIFSEESAQRYLSQYGALGLGYDKEAGWLTFDGRQIILFMDSYADGTFENYFSLATLTPTDAQTVRVITQRDETGALTGLHALTDAEYEKLQGAVFTSRAADKDTSGAAAAQEDGSALESGQYTVTTYAAEYADNEPTSDSAFAVGTAVSGDITLDPDLTAEYAAFGITLDREGDVFYQGRHVGLFWDAENYCYARSADDPLLLVLRGESGSMTGIRMLTVQEVYEITGLTMT